MAYRQVRDVLARARDFHRRLEALYRRSQRLARDERARLLLDFVGRHERNIARVLARYEKDAAEAVLDTWLQFVPDETLAEALRRLELRPDARLDELVGLVLEIDRALVSLYRQLEAETAAPRVQELFRSLLALEEAKDVEVARSALAELQEAGRAAEDGRPDE